MPSSTHISKKQETQTLSKLFHIWATFTAIESLEKLVRAFGLYQFRFTFDRLILVEMFETDLNNAHI